MREQLNWFVDFLGDFPKPDCLEEIPDELPGKEVAAFLADGLKRWDIAIHAVETLDIEHIISCSFGGHRFNVHVWVDDIAKIERWEVCCPSRVGWIRRLFGQSDHEEHKRLLHAIDDTLRHSSQVRDIRWFRHYESPWSRHKFPRYPGPAVQKGQIT